MLSFGDRDAACRDIQPRVKALVRFRFSYTGKIAITSGGETCGFFFYPIEVCECQLSVCLQVVCISKTGNVECEQCAKCLLLPCIHPHEILIACWLISVERIQKQILHLPLQSYLPPFPRPRILVFTFSIMYSTSVSIWMKGRYIDK